MEGGLFQQEEFVEFAKKNVMFVSIMSRVEGREHDNLLQKYGFRGFPSMAILDAEGNKISVPQGRSIKAFQMALQKASDFVTLQQAAADGDPAATKKLAEMNRVKAIQDLMGKANKKNGKKIVKKVFEKFIAGDRLEGDDADFRYYLFLIQGAVNNPENSKALEVFDFARKALERISEENGQVQAMLANANFDQMRAKISGDAPDGEEEEGSGGAGGSGSGGG